jgi:hypothetical protein
MLRKINELTKGEKIAMKVELIDHAMDVISTDIYLDGKLNENGKWLVENDLKGIKLLKKGKGYIHG